MLTERRLHVAPVLISRDSASLRTRLRHQMEIYSFQYKQAVNTFQKEKVALSGKVGGMKDDICICLQLGCYYTQILNDRCSMGLGV